MYLPLLGLVLAVPAFAQDSSPERDPTLLCDELSLEPSEPSDPSPALAPSDWLQGVSRDIERSEYQFSAVEPGVYSAPNRSQGLRSRIDPSGLKIVPRDTSGGGDGAPWKLELRTRAFGRQDQLARVGEPIPSVHENRIELCHEGFTEWYVNDGRGIEQGWTVSVPPPGPGDMPIRIEIEVRGLDARIASDVHSVSFVDAAGKTRLRYGALRAWGANGRDLASRLIRSASGLAVEVEDRGALYPLTIDPILSGPVWTAESNQATAGFGISVSGAGDVNRDGFDDVIVGAYDFDNGQTDEGRAFVFLGSPSGPSATADWTAESNQGFASFGVSVSGAGDVNADGSTT